MVINTDRARSLGILIGSAVLAAIAPPLALFVIGGYLFLVYRQQGMQAAARVLLVGLMLSVAIVVTVISWQVVPLLGPIVTGGLAVWWVTQEDELPPSNLR